MDLAQIGIGVLSGCVIAAAGYFKSREDGALPQFEPVKFIKTAALGAIVGGGTAATGASPDVITGFVGYIGGTVLIENIAKAVIRFFRQR